ncbi:CTP:molybdopterin cytidylyltransferase [Candidatus Velamenicoccus archaeovorus]|uniref:CTP:molybdopterin cytidylyltransferase n=1 Tax=Velamenicoccus archaeovorus TaxID=1930593 RepID=A0A410P2V6_VELA1|nr:nucleotidyltransferase family protein [Candidatus Velamenicoccus archaeovorus]QAT16499.1 CTP:molybdopterin cytidylyltransferase [Candidatus Velamenicoccus archaeovorus]
MVSCIVLAAGASSRFGSPKPLTRLHSRPLISFLSEQLLKTQLGEILVVLGADADAIRPCVCRDPRIKCIFNESFTRGQTSSFKKGLTAVSADTEGVLLLPADTPFVLPETIDTIVETFLKNPFPILVPTYKGRGGHPPVFSKTLFAEFAKLSDEAPLSTVQQIHASEILKLPVCDEGVALSFNTPLEFEKIRNKTSLGG